MSAPALIAAAFVALHLLAAHLPMSAVWGVHFLAYYPLWVQVAVAAVAVCLMAPSPHGRRVLVRIAEILDAACSRQMGRGVRGLSRGILASVGTAAFLLLRSASHLLGDGYLYLHELPRETIRVDHSPLSFWLVKALFEVGSVASLDPEDAYRLYSYLAGLAYLLAVVPIVRTVAAGRRGRAIAAAILLTPGYLQLFCGYVEIYAMAYAGVALYILVGLRVLKGTLPWWVAAGVAGLLLPLHFILLSLVPSLLFLVAAAPAGSGRAARSEENRPAASALAPRPSRVLRGIASLSIAAALLLLILLAIGVDPRNYTLQASGGNLLPFWSPPADNQAYHLFAPRHLLDFLNQQLLAAPAAVLVLLLMRRTCWSARPDRLFLGLAAVAPLAATFAVNPEIGAFRDWDLMAFPAVPLTVWAALALAGEVEDRRLPGSAAWLICAASGLHTLLWIGLNASAGASQARFEELLGAGQLSAHARSYGWETAARYYREQGEPMLELDANERAVEASPANARHWYNAGQARYRLGGRRGAIDYWQRAVQVRPDFVDAFDRLASTHYELGEAEQADRYLRQILALNPDPDHATRIREWLEGEK